MAAVARLRGNALVEFIGLNGETNMDYYDFYEAPIGTIWSSSPWTIRVGTSNFLRSSVKSVAENASMQS